jgi:hypothetical protein
LRIQIDPTEPPPPRYGRWVLLVLGIAFVVLGVLLLAVYGIVGDALHAGGGGCASGASSDGCVSPVFEYVFFVPGLILLALGATFATVAFVRVLRAPTPTA